MRNKVRLAVFASGSGTDFQSIIDAVESGAIECELALLLTNNRDAYAIKRARKHRIPFEIVSSKGFERRELFIRKFLAVLKKHKIDLIALAGYLRKIPPEVIDRYEGKILNIHPGPLPEFGGKGMYGLRVHETVLKANLDKTCVTIHQVNQDYDEGAIIATREVEILPDDTPEILQKRVLKVEHQFYPEILQEFIKNNF